VNRYEGRKAEEATSGSSKDKRIHVRGVGYSLTKKVSSSKRGALRYDAIGIWVTGEYQEGVRRDSAPANYGVRVPAKKGQKFLKKTGRRRHEKGDEEKITHTRKESSFQRERGRTSRKI